MCAPMMFDSPGWPLYCHPVGSFTKYLVKLPTGCQYSGQPGESKIPGFIGTLVIVVIFSLVLFAVWDASEQWCVWVRARLWARFRGCSYLAMMWWMFINNQTPENPQSLWVSNLGPLLHPLGGIEWCSVLRSLVFLYILRFRIFEVRVLKASE